MLIDAERPALFFDYVQRTDHRAKLYGHRVHTPACFAGAPMSDVIFLAVGLGLFCAMGAYIAALRGL